ncbi:MAG: winged helix-turn-helix domain-containing protein [Mesorhizobium sp.]|nr:MAG: winged helix-turn-helix domain-containing protein [Mesorhizobium sp.]
MITALGASKVSSSNGSRHEPASSAYRAGQDRLRQDRSLRGIGAGHQRACGSHGLRLDADQAFGALPLPRRPLHALPGLARPEPRNPDHDHARPAAGGRVSEHGLTDTLLRLLGPAGLVRLAERHGGTRLYIPATPERGKLADELGIELAEKLSRRFGPDYLSVPLVRELRARHYRSAGCSNADIARKLGLSESAVNRLFQRMDNVPVKGSGDPRQLKLFG